jgi:alkaline phosphatase
MVEGGRIDHAHHAGNAQRALVDAIAFSEAIDKAVEMTDVNNTLILVTADHSHTLTISGYPSRGNPILGYASIGNEPLEDEDGNPYTTLGYINGPGALDLPNSDDPEDLNYRQLSAIPLRSETHAGEDVAAYALGPGALRLRGVIDQNEIYNVMLESVK